MTGTAAGPSRAEIISTVTVVLLVALAVLALWPDTGSSDVRGAGVPVAVAVPDIELAPLRSGAALEPCPTGRAAAPTGPLAGVTAPCLGEPRIVDLGAVLAGRPALLNVWASWCGPCRAELPVVAAYAARTDAITVLGIDVRDDPRAALRLLAEIGVALPSVTDPDGAITAALDIPPALPMSYLVRADGTVARVDPPVPFRTPDEVAAAVDRLLVS